MKPSGDVLLTHVQLSVTLLAIIRKTLCVKPLSIDALDSVATQGRVIAFLNHGRRGVAHIRAGRKPTPTGALRLTLITPRVGSVLSGAEVCDDAIAATVTCLAVVDNAISAWAFDDVNDEPFNDDGFTPKVGLKRDVETDIGDPLLVFCWKAAILGEGVARADGGEHGNGYGMLHIPPVIFVTTTLSLVLCQCKCDCRSWALTKD